MPGGLNSRINGVFWGFTQKPLPHFLQKGGFIGRRNDLILHQWFIQNPRQIKTTDMDNKYRSGALGID